MAKKKATPNPKPPSAAVALRKLKKGNERCVGHDPINYPTEKERSVFKGAQWPYAIVLSCADSRVSPEVMFNAGLNELFVIRVAGNIADTTSIASIEYAVSQLGTKLIVVMGHEGCGAVNAALGCAAKPTDLGYNLNTLLSHIEPAVAATEGVRKTQRLEQTVRTNAELTAKELRTRSPIIAKTRGVKIVPAYYHLVSGEVEFAKPV